MAGEDKNVILIDCDMRRSRVAAPGNYLGLAEYLDGTCEVADVISQDRETMLNMIAAGHSPDRAPKLLNSARMRQLVQALSKSFDVVILDTPPVLPVADTRIIAPLVDLAVVLIQWQRTPRKLANRCLSMLSHANPTDIGLVFSLVRALPGYASRRYLRGYVQE